MASRSGFRGKVWVLGILLATLSACNSTDSVAPKNASADPESRTATFDSTRAPATGGAQQSHSPAPVRIVTLDDVPATRAIEESSSDSKDGPTLPQGDGYIIQCAQEGDPVIPVGSSAVVNCSIKYVDQDGRPRDCDSKDGGNFMQAFLKHRHRLSVLLDGVDVAAQAQITSPSRREIKIRYQTPVFSSVRSPVFAVLAMERNSQSVLSEYRMPLLVGNAIGASGLQSAVIGRYRLTVSFPQGIVFQGEDAIIQARVEATAREGHAAEKITFSWNKTPFAVEVRDLAPGQAVTKSFTASAVSPMAQNRLGIELVRMQGHEEDDDKGKGKAKKSGQSITLAEFYGYLRVAGDGVAPVIALITPEAQNLYVQYPQPLAATISDARGRVNPNSIQISAQSFLDNGQELTRGLTASSQISSSDQGRSYSISRDLADLEPGLHTLTLNGRDYSGNLAAPATVVFTIDRTPPVLSNIAPAPNGILQALEIQVSGRSDEVLTGATARVSGTGIQQNLVLSEDQKSFSGSLVLPSQGDYTLSIIATDRAANLSSVDIPIQVFIHALTGNLLSVVPVDTGHLAIKGAPGATRPGITVNASAGFFNAGSAVGDGQGAFSITLRNFQQATVSATDPVTGNTDSATVTFGNTNGGTLLAGSVQDTDGVAIVGATISLANSTVPPVTTDASGVFAFTEPVTGDQTIIVNGTTASVALGVMKRYSVTHVPVSIGLSQSNVLQRPIVLAPIYTDGTATQFDGDQGGTVTDVHAPGVALSIPEGVTTFPDGSSAGLISMSTVSSDAATVAPYDFAMPENVTALEPSGTKFAERIPIRLPNENHLPSGVEMVLMVFDSEKCAWTIGGTAAVSANGQDIVSKPGQGINHFSLVYATPIGPTVLPISQADIPGADSFNGALSRAIDLPGYKSLGSNVAPGLMWKSSWAKPTTLVTNLFDIPRHEINLSEQPGANGQIRTKVNAQICVLFCFDNIVDAYADYSTRGTAWYQPRYITAQFFTSNFASEEMKFTGVPNRATISYAMDLKNPASGQFLPSGVLPYQSKYKVYLDQIVIGTRTVTTWSSSTAPQTRTTDLSDTRQIEQAFPQDLGGPLFVVNKTQSHVGRGWRIGGYQTIANPNNNRILIEEADGQVSSYILASSMHTLHEGSVSGVDVNLGVDLNQWPKAYLTRAGASEIVQTDLTQLGSSTTSVGSIFGLSGSIAGRSFTSDANFPTCGFFGCTNQFEDICMEDRWSFNAGSSPAQLLGLPNGSVLAVDRNRSVVMQVSGGASAVLAGQLQSAPYVIRDGQGFNGANVYNPAITGFCGANGTSCSRSAGNYFIACHGGSDCRNGNPFNWFVTYGTGGRCPVTLTSSGQMPAPGFNGDSNFSSQFNQPSGMAPGPRANTIVVADTGNNRVRLLDLSNSSVTTVAGNGQYFGTDIGEGLVATDASVSHPRGVAYDSIGNLYISLESGVIRKVDTTGKISTFAGATNGAIFADVIEASDASFSNPYGLVVDNDRGYLYIADTGHHRVVRVDFLTKTAANVAGNGSAADSADGLAALNSSLSSPTHLGLDDQGNLLIADSGNNKIKRVTFQTQANGVLAYTSTKTDDLSKLTREADGTFTRTYRNGNRVYFSAQGQHLRSVDRVGRVTTFTYNSGGDLVSMTDPTGRSVQYQYSGTMLSQITDPAGRATQFTYDSHGDLTSVRFPDGSQKFYTYSSDGLMRTETDQRGFVATFNYNEWNRLTSVSEPTGTSQVISDSGSATVANNFVNGSTGTLTSYGTEPGQVSDQMTDAKGQTTTFIKSSLGVVSQVVDSAGRTKSVKRDALGRPLVVTRADDSTVTFHYDPNTGDLLSQEDSTTGVTTSQTFDAYGNILSSRGGRGFTSSVEYSPTTGQMLAKINELGQRTSFTYNGPFGLMDSSVNPLGVTATSSYDAVGNLVESTDPLGKKTRYTYDSTGNVTSVTDPEGRVTSYTYDVMNRLTSVTSPKLETTTYHYLASGQLERIVDALGNVTTMTYDSKGRLLTKTDPLGEVMHYTYDNNGNTTQIVDPNGNIKTYEYDDRDKLIAKHTADNDVTLTYDVIGKLVEATNRESKVTFNYDASGRMLSTHSQGRGAYAGIPAVTLAFDYDADNNRTELTDPTGTSTFTYDAVGRRTGISNPKGESFGITYDAVGRPIAISRPGGSTSLTYNDRNALLSLVHGSSSGTDLASYGFQWSDSGDLVGITEGAVNRTLAYDANRQLISATNPSAPAPMQAENFTYDSIHNRTGDQDPAHLYQYDNKKQRLVQDWKNYYFYDHNGNQISKQAKGISGDVTAFKYSAENQLLGFTVYAAPSGYDPSVLVSSQGTPVKRATYVYDPMGRRIHKKVEDFTAPSDPKKSFARSFVYDGNEILLEYDGNNQLLARYTNSGLGADSVMAVDVKSAGVDAGLAQSAGSYFYLKDGRGSIADIADESGNRLQHYVYSTFGEIVAIQDASEGDISAAPILNTSRTFTGRELDSESGNYYFRARYMDPRIGRFLQKDPSPGALSVPMSVVNGYVYAGNSPFGLFDPSGMSFLETVRDIVVGAVAAWVASMVVAALVVSNVLTGGVAGVIEGAIIGAVVGAVVGGTTAGVIHGVDAVVNGRDFFQGFGEGFGHGMVVGAIAGFMAGGMTAYARIYGANGTSATQAGESSRDMQSRFQSNYNGTTTESLTNSNGGSFNGFEVASNRSMSDMAGSTGGQNWWIKPAQRIGCSITGTLAGGSCEALSAPLFGIMTPECIAVGLAVSGACNFGGAL